MVLCLTRSWALGTRFSLSTSREKYRKAWNAVVSPRVTAVTILTAPLRTVGLPLARSPDGELEQTLPNAATRLHRRRHARKGCPRSRAASSFGQKWQARDRVGSALAEIPRVANSSIDIMRYRGSRRRRDSFVGASPSEPRPRKVGGTNLRGHLQCMPSHSAGNQA